MLPELDEFKSFPTVGPNGKAKMDINSKAAAIECYLDLKQPGLPEPTIRWSTDKGDVQQYQGALQKKESYMKDFIKRPVDELLNSNYDLSKLFLIIDSIYSQCVNIAADRRKKMILGEMD